MDAELERTRLLIAAARTGQREAYEALFDMYRAELARSLGRRFPTKLRRRVEVSDVIQETLLDAVKGFEAFEYRGVGSFRGWLARIAENRLRMTLDFHAGRARRDLARETPLAVSGSTGVGAALAIAEISTPSSAALASEQREQVAAALASLSPDHAEVVRRVKLRGESLAEVAVAMRRSENAIKKLLARALLELGAHLRK